MLYIREHETRRQIKLFISYTMLLVFCHIERMYKIIYHSVIMFSIIYTHGYLITVIKYSENYLTWLKYIYRNDKSTSIAIRFIFILSTKNRWLSRV